MANSILQSEKECYITRRTDELQRHHIFFGSNRSKSKKCGCWVWLRPDWHTGDYGPHHNRELDLLLKRACQKKFEETHTREDFVRIFGKNWLDVYD